jgi:hypothetical protein
MESQGRLSGTRVWAAVIATAMVAIGVLAVQASAQLPVQPPLLPVGPTGPVNVPAPSVPTLPAPAPKPPPAPKAPAPKPPAPSAPTPNLPAPKPPAAKPPAAKPPAPTLNVPKVPALKLPATPNHAPSLPIVGGSGSGSGSAPLKVTLPGGGTVQVPSVGGGGGGGAAPLVGGVGGLGTAVVGGTAQTLTSGGSQQSIVPTGPGFGGGAGGLAVVGGLGGAGGGGALGAGGGLGGSGGPGGPYTGPGGGPAGPGPAAAILLQAEMALEPGLSSRGGGVSALDVQAAIVSLSGCLSAITPLERSLLMLRYGLDGGSIRSRAEVGRALRLSPARAMRVERQALHNLRVAATSTNCSVVASASGLPVSFDPTTVAAAGINPFGATPGSDGRTSLGGGPARAATAMPIFTGDGHGNIGWLLLAMVVLGGLLLAGGVLARGYQRSMPQMPAPDVTRRPAQTRPRPASARRGAPAHGHRRAGSRRESVRFRRQGKAQGED